MVRYINADSLKQRVKNNWYTSTEIMDDIDAEPTADVVEKERYDILLEHANILAEELRKYQNERRQKMRAIDADELLTNTDDLEHVKWSQEYGHVVLVCDIVYAPTLDVVEVVRCKDCKHLSEDRIAPDFHRICRKYGVGKPDDGFCDEVERKETE